MQSSPQYLQSHVGQHQPSHVLGTNSHHGLFISKHTVLIVAGVFLFIAAVAAATSTAGGKSGDSRALTVESSASDANSDTGSPPAAKTPGTDPPPAGSSSNSTSVNVNGQNISVSANGSTSRTIVDDNGTTTVNVSNHSSQSSSGGSNSSSQTLNINVNSSSSSTSGN